MGSSTSVELSCVWRVGSSARIPATLDLDLIVAGRKITAEDAREAAKYTLGNTVKTLSEETANGDPDTAKALRKALEPLFPAKTFSSIKKIS